VIKDIDTGAVDVGFDTDENAANLPSGYEAYRWIGFVKLIQEVLSHHLKMSDNLMAFDNVYETLLNLE